MLSGLAFLQKTDYVFAIEKENNEMREVWY